MLSCVWISAEADGTRPCRGRGNEPGVPAGEPLRILWRDGAFRRSGAAQDPAPAQPPAPAPGAGTARSTRRGSQTSSGVTAATAWSSSVATS